MSSLIFYPDGSILFAFIETYFDIESPESLQLPNLCRAAEEEKKRTCNWRAPRSFGPGCPCAEELPHRQLCDHRSSPAAGCWDSDDLLYINIDKYLKAICWKRLKLVTNWTLCPKWPPPPLESIIGWDVSMLKAVVMPNNVNNNVSTKVDQLIEGDGGTSIFSTAGALVVITV